MIGRLQMIGFGLRDGIGAMPCCEGLCALADHHSSSGPNEYPSLSTTLPSCVIGT
jgi:hypothetical protein